MIVLRALVTGASGFVGGYLTDRLTQLNYEVMGISRTEGLQNKSRAISYNCDILDQNKIEFAISEFKPDYIFHLAAPAYIPNSFKEPKLTYNVIFNGTFNVLEAVKNIGLNPKILYVSSADVYGRAGNRELIYESDNFDPINPYAASKACAEILCKQFYETYGMQIIIARPFNHTGPGQSDDFVCSNFARQIAKMSKSMSTDSKLLTGNVDVSRDFLDVRDVVNAYIELASHAKIGEVYNVSSGVPITVRNIINLLFQESGIKDYNIVVDQEKIRQREILKRTGNNEKLVTETQWKQTISINKTLSDLYNYWRESV
ncbi:GDP-mannose 4,6-dehydratase [Paenibacillus chitinolyticus]|uniref:GDP-mannose 4,6-dehydratase n=1 Tax=Paenibacillus chitinolyticus TaxID=79263 RepID=UPI0036DC15E7